MTKQTDKLPSRIGDAVEKYGVDETVRRWLLKSIEKTYGRTS